MFVAGLSYSILCMLAYALTNIFFKASANMELNPFLLVALSSIFAGGLFLLKGGPSNLAKKALTSKYTWLYGISEFLDLCFVMSISYYVSATEGALVTRIAILVSVFAAHLFLKRSAFKKEYLGLIPVTLGLIMVFADIENLGIVLTLSILVAVVRNIYYFSIELHPVPYETKNMAQDYSIIGYIVSASGLFVLVLLFISALVSEIIGEPVIHAFPVLSDFVSIEMLIMSGLFGATILFTTKFLEFKAIQIIKTEMFNCIVAFSPLVTFILELMLSKSPYYQTNLSVSAYMIGANLFIVFGGAYIFYRRYAMPVLDDDARKRDVRGLVISATLFYKEDYQKAANALDISLHTLHDIMDSECTFKIRKDVADKIERKHHKNISMSDPLTGLTNRLQFETHLKDVHNKKMALLFIDLNKFKAVNDTYGHEAGDYILSGTAARLLDYIKEMSLPAIVTRLGGDEFCMLITDADKSEAYKITERAVEIICEPYKFDGIDEELSVGAAVGVAHYPTDTDNPSALLSIADKNMYKDKEGEGR